MPTKKMPFANLQNGFFVHKGKFYYATAWGQVTFHFPIVNGVISRTKDDINIYPDEEIEVIPRVYWPEYGLPVDWEKD